MAWVNPNRDAILREQGLDGQATLCSAPASTDRQPPESEGRVFATFDRPGKFGKPDEQLRVEVAEYNSHQYISLRVWTKSASGQYWPSQRGLSVKTREARDLADALHQAMDRIEGDDPADEPAPRRPASSRGASQGQGAAASARPDGGGTFSRDDRQLPAGSGYASGDGFNEY